MGSRAGRRAVARALPLTAAALALAPVLWGLAGTASDAVSARQPARRTAHSLGRLVQQAPSTDRPAAASQQASPADPLAAGIEALRRGDLEAAIASLEEAVRRAPDAVRPRFHLGVAYLRSARPAAAAEQLSRAEELAPGFDASIAFQLGLARMRQGRYEEARRRFEAILERDPDAVPPRLNLGWMLMREDRGEAALEIFHDIVADAPDNALARYYIGLVHQGNGRFGPAAEAYRRAVERDPGFGRALLALGRLALSRGQEDDAAAWLERAARAWPDGADVWFHLGLLALRDARLAEAIERFERALALDPEHRGARYNLGLAYARAGQDVAADLELATFAALRADAAARSREELRAATLSPAEAARRAGVEALEAGDAELALRRFESALELAGSAPDDERAARLQLGRGAALRALGRLDAARGALEAAVDADPELAEAYRLLVDVYDSLGLDAEAERARRAYARLLAQRREPQ